MGFFSGTKYKFYSVTRGRIQIVDDRLFVQSSDQGEIFEIICSQKILNNEKCHSNYIFSSIYSGFYPNTGFSVNGKYVKDMIYIGDFYKEKLEFLN